MKWITHLSSVFLALCLGCNAYVGTNADYVLARNRHSDGTVHHLVSNDTIVVDGKEQRIEPYYTYNCPSGLTVFIDVGEPHPNVDSEVMK
jgi:hypothetical protein